MAPANPVQDRGSTMFNNHCSRGELYEAGSGVVGLTLSVGILRGVLSNPSNSGKNILVTNVRLGSTATTAQSVTLRFNPTTVPSNAVTPWNRLATLGSTSQATFTYDTSSSALSGGTAGPSYGVYSGILTAIVDEYNPILLQPGVSVGFSTSAFGLTANGECIMNWIEVSV